MTLCEKLVAHKGRLILLKTELWWYGGRGWDGCPGRICLILDTGLTYDSDNYGYPAPTATTAAAARTGAAVALVGGAAACLLIDGRPHWVWIAPADVELL
jgi:hypothetical protein